MSRRAQVSTPEPRRLAMDYRLHDEFVLGEVWDRHVERWIATVTGEDGDPVGYAHVIILNLDGDLQIGDLADAASGAWREPDTPRVLPLVGADGGSAGVLGNHVLVLDRVFIEPAHRGAGLGPVVAALAIGRLRRGCRVAVCFPAPFDGPRTDDERERSIVALGKIWATVGFQPRPDGVWALNLEDDSLPTATRRLMGPYQ